MTPRRSSCSATLPQTRPTRLAARRRRTAFLTLLVVLGGLSSVCRADEAPAAPSVLPPVNVVGTTPLPGLDLPQDRIPAPVQTATGAEIDRRGALSIADFMNRRFGSVHVNDIQGNPLQPDISYRGYTASPLLGTPQGLSVFVDGVRINQPFGDVVSWDLLPRSAIASITLMPGSNPLFGLNTLGGALAVQTKSGDSHPGSSLQISAGSHGSARFELETGGNDMRGLSWFGTANVFRDGGWRDASPSRLGQVFGKLGWHDGATQVWLSASGASSDLYGNGLQDGPLLASRYASVYTRPDRTRNDAGLASVAFTHDVGERWSLSGQLYLRRIGSRTLNGDVNADALDQSLYALSASDRAALSAAGIGAPATVDASTTPFPYLRCIARVLQDGDAASACNALLNRSRSMQTNGGITVQASGRVAAGAALHQLVVGAAFDASRTRFEQSTDAGFLAADRSATDAGVWLAGRGVDVDAALPESAVSLGARTRTASLFGADTISFGSDLHLTAAARYNRTTVANRDALHPAPDPASLDGDHVFARLNPALGANWNPSRALHLYAGYNESSRTPTAIELGCANPDQPCKLPNALAGDPPLRQVVVHTIEAGANGEALGNVRWRAGVFRSDARDDLLFVSSDASGHGYFRNFGQTRRQGLELGAAATGRVVSVDLAWTLLDARFRSREALDGTGNSSNDAGPGLAGSIAIAPGDRLPLVPRQIFKAGVQVALGGRVRFDADLFAASAAIARGNENNGHAPDGIFYLGPGHSPGYAVTNLGLTVQATPALRVFARVGNVFDRRYATAAQLGVTAFDAGGRFVSQPFPANAAGNEPLRSSTLHAPGAPRSLGLGLRYAFE
ncbi:MAG: TonB-dependent receptor [Caldimonas sp.]